MSKKLKLKIIPLGGLNEIGKNMTVFEYGNNIVVVDCGLAFPDIEMPGIDLVIPDVSYLVKNADKIRGIVLTHGHEDHIGSLPYVLKQINVPVYGTRLTLGLVQSKLKEHGLLQSTKLITVKAGDDVTLGCMKVEFIRVTHSVADSVALAIHTPVGIVVHTGDFKVDFTPLEGEIMDLARLGQLGKMGVLAFLCDSTNVERPGYTMSESTVGDALDEIFRHSDQRIMVATFASNVHRLQQIINAAVKYGRKVAINGRSMENVSAVAMELGYLTIPENTLITIDEIKKYPNNKVAIVTTGSQGEPMSALYRMAFADHRKIDIIPGDLVVLSASPIPGNEKTVSKVINELFKRGADVIYESLAEVHVSGHACQEELKLVHSLVKPKFFMPVHGEFRHLQQHGKLAQSLGMDSKDIFVMDIGKVLELDEEEAKITGSVTSGKILVDGLGVGDVGNIVLRDRKHLAQDGLIVVVVTISSETGSVIAGPDIISRGFVYVREAEELMEHLKQLAKNTLARCEQQKVSDWATLKTTLKNVISDYLMGKTRRKPMILPVIMEI
ncbi:MAG: ribonuclease J [Hyphomonadaceae bacterium]|nr:ribonuclease J [Clostridia bacterium]